ncbi:MAG: sulfotransferase family protein [Actinomycetes bacterium]
MTDTAPFTIIIGCPRSGTTLLRAMLDSHPLLAVPPESYFLVPVLREAASYRTADGIDRPAIMRDIAANVSWPSWQVDPSVLDGIAADESLTTVPATLRAVYDRYAALHGKVRAIDKTPRHTEHVALIDRSYPDCRFVHLVRDGRDVVPSLQSMPYFPARFADATLYWRDRVLSGREARTVVGPARYHELRYEDLVTDPERHLEALCRFLAVEYAPEMLDYTSRAESVISGTVGGAAHENIRRAPTRTRDWHTDMDRRDVARFEALAGDALAIFGYDRGPSPSVPVRLEAMARHGVDTLGKRSRILRARVRRRLPGA